MSTNNQRTDCGKTERGQGLLEMVVILPVLLILMVGVAEIGFGLRNYIVVCNADREAVRFAARGRYNDKRVVDRVISAGGIVRLGGADVPFLRAAGTDPNTGIIVTHLPMDSSGAVVSTTVYISGVITTDAGTMRPITPGDSRISQGEIKERHSSMTQEINATRVAAMYEPMENHIVVVEVFFAHQPLLITSLVPMPEPWPMHAHTMMRVTRGR